MSNLKIVIASHARNIYQDLNDTYLVVLTVYLNNNYIIVQWDV
jgi:hypothetical protein